jgi:hypothetical protein
MPRPRGITTEEIQAEFSDPATAASYPPLMTYAQCAQLFQVSVRTLKQWIAQGKFDGATQKIGKHRRFLRNKTIQLFMAGQ